MLSKVDFITKLRNNNSNESVFFLEQAAEEYWDYAAITADEALAKMPGTGFFSARKSYNAVVAVGREIDHKLHDEVSNQQLVTLIFSIMRISSTKFDVAFQTFLKVVSKASFAEIGALPKSLQKAAQSVLR